MVNSLARDACLGLCLGALALIVFAFVGIVFSGEGPWILLAVLFMAGFVCGLGAFVYLGRAHPLLVASTAAPWMAGVALLQWALLTGHGGANMQSWLSLFQSPWDWAYVASVPVGIVVAALVYRGSAKRSRGMV